MKIRIRHKLFLANLITTLVVMGMIVTANYVNFRWVDARLIESLHQQEYALINRLGHQLSLAQNTVIQQISTDEGQWQAWLNGTISPMITDFPELQFMLSSPPPGEKPRHLLDEPLPLKPPPGPNSEFNNSRPQPPQLAKLGFLTRRLYLVNEQGEILAGRKRSEEIQYQVTIKRQGESDMQLVLQPAGGRMPNEQLLSHYKFLSLIMIGVVIISLFVSNLLARHITAPIQKLIGGAKRLAERQFDTNIQFNSEDELAELAEHFNFIGRRLLAYQHRQQQWLQDIAHELRTPMSIIQGQIEAMKDGVLDTDPQNVKLLYNDVMRLSRLMTELNELLLTEPDTLNLKLSRVDIAALLEQLKRLFELRYQQRNLSLTLKVTPCHCVIDNQRIEQVIINLLENCFHYVLENGQVEVSASCSTTDLSIIVADSGPGVPEEAMPYLFDRLYRVDPARQSDGNHSGLGLAICRNIIRAHHGTISAQKSPLGGLQITLCVPLNLVNKDIA